MADRDDDALSWDGDIRDPTYVDRPSRDVRGGAGDDDSTNVEDVDPAEDGVASGSGDADAPAGGGSVLLVVFGAAAAAYLLFTVGWAIAVTRGGVVLPNPFFDAMYRFGSGLAVAAPAAWFGTVFLLTRTVAGRRQSLARIALLGVGLVLVAPWPFIAGGAA